jgi:hypothetical protein
MSVSTSASRAVSPAVQMAVLLLAVAGAVALVGLQGNDAAFLGVFPAVCLAALTLPVHLSVAVAGAAIVAVSAASAANGRAGVAGVVLNDFAILAFYVLSLFARRLRESNQRAELLVSELSRAGRRRPKPPRWPSASAWPARCTMCSPTRCPAWC